MPFGLNERDLVKLTVPRSLIGRDHPINDPRSNGFSRLLSANSGALNQFVARNAKDNGLALIFGADHCQKFGAALPGHVGSVNDDIAFLREGRGKIMVTLLGGASGVNIERLPISDVVF